MRRGLTILAVLLVLSALPLASDARPEREERVLRTVHKNVNVLEGDSGTKTLLVHVEVFPPPSGTSYAADYEVVPVTAERPTDFEALFPKGEIKIDEENTSPTIEVKIVGDKGDEINETIRIDIFNQRCTSSGPCDIDASDASPSGFVTIADDDGEDTPGPGMQFLNGFVDSTVDDECIIEVQLDYGWDKPITVDYETDDLEAESGDDYEKTEGTMGFSPGQMRKDLVIRVNQDRDMDVRNERFVVEFSNAKGATLLEQDAQCTFVDRPSDRAAGADRERRRRKRG
jgi:hypothetical protein